MQQITVAVSEMDKVVQSNSASAEESAAAAEELNAQAGMLKEAVDDLRRLIGGDRNGSHAVDACTVAPARSLRAPILAA